MLERTGAGRRADAPPRVPDNISESSEITELLASCLRPSILMSEREISVLRRGLTKQGWKRSIYLQPAAAYGGIYAAGGILSRANKALDVSVDIPRRGGRMEDALCECGAPLRPPENLNLAPDYQCSGCDRKLRGPAFDAAVRLMQHQELVGTALDLALVYAIERDKAYAEKAAEILLGYADLCASQPAEQDCGGIAQDPVDEAACIVALAQSYDLIYYARALTGERRARIESLMRTAAEGLVSMNSEGPRGSWYLAAVGVVGFALRETYLVEHALDGVRTQLCDQIGNDGLWPAPLAAHFQSLAALVHFAEACCRCGIDLYNWEPAPGRTLKAMFAAPLHCAYPSFALPPVKGDSSSAYVPVDLYEIASRRWEDLSFAWALKKGYKLGAGVAADESGDRAASFSRTSFYAFLFGRDLPGRVGAPVIRDRSFPDLGLSALRCDGSMATLYWGCCTDSPDECCLSFAFYSNGGVLAPDCIRRPQIRQRLEGPACGAARNVILVDGRCFRKTEPGLLLSAQEASYLHHTSASASCLDGSVEHVRRLVLLDGLCLVADTLIGDSAHDYDWVMRLHGDPHIAGEQAEAAADWGKCGLPEVDRVYSLGSGRRIDWTCAGGRASLAVWPGSDSGLMGVGTGPAGHTSAGTSVVVCRQRGLAAEFVAALAASCRDDIEMAKDGRVVSIRRGDRTDFICVGLSGETSASQRLRTDGEVAAVELRGDRISAVAVTGGSLVEWDGEMLLECPGRVGSAQVCFAERNPLVTYQGGQPGVIRIKTSARAMRVNGHRTAAASSGGHALLRIDSLMLVSRGL